MSVHYMLQQAAHRKRLLIAVWTVQQVGVGRAASTFRAICATQEGRSATGIAPNAQGEKSTSETTVGFHHC